MSEKQIVMHVYCDALEERVYFWDKQTTSLSRLQCKAYKNMRSSLLESAGRMRNCENHNAEIYMNFLDRKYQMLCACFTKVS